MERIKLFTAALLLAAISAGNDVWALSDSRKKDTRPIESPKFFSGNANPLLDFIFGPTRHRWNTTEGSLRMELSLQPARRTVWDKYGKNTYQYPIHWSKLSNDDMVNWTYHGLFDERSRHGV